MGLESVTYIDDLNELWPLGTDAKSAGDDHIRRIKAAIKATFPEIAGEVEASHTELSFCVGVTSAIQTQLNAKQPLDAELTAIAGLTSAAESVPYFTGSGTASLATFTVLTQLLLDKIGTTQGSLLYHNGTDWVALAPGTNGRLLTTQGAGANPTWGPAPNDQRVSFVAYGAQSRSLNTSYLNGTNFRFVCWSYNENGQGTNQATIQTSPDNSTWTTVAHAYPYNYVVGRSLFAIVPPNYYYRYSCGGSPSNNQFYEAL